jgi:hypothetical protein
MPFDEISNLVEPIDGVARTAAAENIVIDEVLPEIKRRR